MQNISGQHLGALPDDLRKPHRAGTFPAALAISMLVHICILFGFGDLLERLYNAKSVALETSKALEVSFRIGSQAVELNEESSESEPFDLRAGPDHAITDIKIANDSAPADELGPNTGAIDTDKQLETTSTSRWTALMGTLPGSSASDSILDAINGGCDPREKESAIRRCNSDEDLDFKGAAGSRFEGAFASAFAHLQVTETVRRDMIQLESMLAHHEELELLAANPDVDLAFIRARQRELTFEIDRIDAKYASADLIEFIVVSGKFIKALASALSDRTKP